MPLETSYRPPANSVATCVAISAACTPLLATPATKVSSKIPPKIRWGMGLVKKYFPKLLEWDKIIQSLLLICVAAVLIVAVILPLIQIIMKSLSNADGIFVGLANYKTYFESPALWRSAKNSIFISSVTTILVVPAAFAYAYGLTRTLIQGRGILLGLAMVPLLAPTLLNGLALVYLFGRQGLITKVFLVFCRV